MKPIKPEITADEFVQGVVRDDLTSGELAREIHADIAKHMKGLNEFADKYGIDDDGREFLKECGGAIYSGGMDIAYKFLKEQGQLK